MKTIAFAEAKDGKKTSAKKEAPAAEEADAPESPAPTPTPAPAPAEAEPLRARAPTASMEEAASVGAAPALPTVAPAAAPVVIGAVEEPTHMPHPRDVPGGSPDDAAPPPGRVPPGDSRSLRNATQFALLYRIGTFVITRSGTVGQRGQWRVVEYPTTASASHAYAKESSRFVSEGFSDYRD